MTIKKLMKIRPKIWKKELGNQGIKVENQKKIKEKTNILIDYIINSNLLNILN
jgi:hypothetical protein